QVRRHPPPGRRGPRPDDRGGVSRVPGEPCGRDPERGRDGGEAVGRDAPGGVRARRPAAVTGVSDSGPESRLPGIYPTPDSEVAMRVPSSKPLSFDDAPTDPEPKAVGRSEARRVPVVLQVDRPAAPARYYRERTADLRERREARREDRGYRRDDRLSNAPAMA